MKETQFKLLALFLVLITIPIWWQKAVSGLPFIFIIITTIGWISFSIIKNQSLKLISISVLTIINILGLCFFSGLINNKGNWNRELTFWVDQKDYKKIESIKEQALYFPFRGRTILWGNWIIIGKEIDRTISWLWPDKYLSLLGIPAVVMVIWVFLKKKRLIMLIPIILTVATGVIHRNPNNSLIYFILLPILFPMVWIGVNIIPKKWLTVILISGFIYLVTI